MSRFEPDVEPSMEEILASIRKIIAEDTSGSRTVPPIRPASPSPSPSPSPSLQTPRAATNAIPAAAPQRGFMSREAFLRSSAPAAQETSNQQRYFTPASPAEPKLGANPDTEAENSRPSIEAEKVVVAPAAATPAIEPAKPPNEASEKPGRGDHEAVETKVADEAERRLRPSTPAETKSETAAQTVDAQLVELVEADLKALHDAKKSDLAEPETENKSEIASVSVERAVPNEDMAQKQPSEPVAEPSSISTAAVEPISPLAEEPAKKAESQDNSDPFAFDLGPSPFQPRATEHPAERHISIDPDPGYMRSSGSSRNDAPAYGQRDTHKINGSPVSGRPQPTAPPPKSDVPAAAPASGPSQSPARPTFAVPSVSATLGPHRRLEPLSDAFKPEIADHRSKPEVAPVNPFPSRDFGLSSEKPSPAEPGPAQPDAVLKPSLQLPSALPALLDTTANPAGDGDRAMEDAVADLLRPLLKTWLAENMPRILERALQREMTESLFPGEKNSRD